MRQIKEWLEWPLKRCFQLNLKGMERLQNIKMLFEILSGVDNFYANVKATRIEHVISLETDKILEGRQHPAFVKLWSFRKSPLKEWSASGGTRELGQEKFNTNTWPGGLKEPVQDGPGIRIGTSHWTGLLKTGQRASLESGYSQEIVWGQVEEMAKTDPDPGAQWRMPFPSLRGAFVRQVLLLELPKMVPGEMTTTSDPTIFSITWLPSDNNQVDTHLICTPAKVVGISGPIVQMGKAKRKEPRSLQRIWTWQSAPLPLLYTQKQWVVEKRCREL